MEAPKSEPSKVSMQKLLHKETGFHYIPDYRDVERFIVHVSTRKYFLGKATKPYIYFSELSMAIYMVKDNERFPIILVRSEYYNLIAVNPKQRKEAKASERRPLNAFNREELAEKFNNEYERMKTLERKGKPWKPRLLRIVAPASEWNLPLATWDQDHNLVIFWGPEGAIVLGKIPKVHLDGSTRTVN